MSPDDFVQLLNETFPTDRPATFDDVAAFLHRVKQTFDADEMTLDEQRQALTKLQIETILMDKAVAEAESPAHPWTEAEARERIQHWLAVFWPPC